MSLQSVIQPSTNFNYKERRNKAREEDKFDTIYSSKFFNPLEWIKLSSYNFKSTINELKILSLLHLMNYVCFICKLVAMFILQCTMGGRHSQKCGVNLGYCLILMEWPHPGKHRYTNEIWKPICSKRTTLDSSIHVTTSVLESSLFVCARTSLGCNLPLKVHPKKALCVMQGYM